MCFTIFIVIILWRRGIQYVYSITGKYQRQLNYGGTKYSINSYPLHLTQLYFRSLKLKTKLDHWSTRASNLSE